MRKGRFKDFNGTVHVVEIDDGQEAEATLRLGGTPFKVEMKGGDLYEPVKTSTATIQVVLGDMDSGLYTSDPLGRPVTLATEDGRVEWAGYLTPCAYSQPYAQHLETMDLEARDILGVLKDIKYEAEPREFRTFRQLLERVLGRAPLCRYYYYQQMSWQTGHGTFANILDICGVSDANFFSKKSKGQQDKDVAWTCHDVLAEVCRYIGATLVAKGDGAALVDYDLAHRVPDTVWRRKALNGVGGLVAFQFPQQAVGDWASADTDLSLDKTYGEVKVKGDYYEVGDLIDDLFKDAVNVTEPDEETRRNADWSRPKWGEVFTDYKGENPTEALLCRQERGGKNVDVMRAVFVRYLSTEKATLLGGGAASGAANYSGLMVSPRAYLASYCVKTLEDASDDSNAVDRGTLCGNTSHYYGKGFQTGTAETLNSVMMAATERMLERKNVDSLSFTDYLVLTGTGDTVPYVQFASSEKLCALGGAVVLISGSVLPQMWATAFPNPDYPVRKVTGMFRTDLYNVSYAERSLRMRLGFGGQWWDGEAWQAEACDFDVPLAVDGVEDTATDHPEVKFKDYIYHEHQIANTTKWRDGVGSKGYCVKLPQGGAMAGRVELTLYGPKAVTQKDTHRPAEPMVRVAAMFLKDFKVKVATARKTEDVDTVYKCKTSSKQAAKEIKCKINSFDGTRPSYSNVTDGEGHYMDNVLCFQITEAEQAAGLDPEDTGLRMEEHVAFRWANQHGEPRMKVTATLRRDLSPLALATWMGKTFAVNAKSTDFAQCEHTYELIEKA